MTKEEIRTKARTFLVSNFLALGDEAELDDSESLLEQGIVDSTGVLELVGFIQDTFDIEVRDEEIVPTNLDTVDNLVVFIEGKLAVRRAKSA